MGRGYLKEDPKVADMRQNIRGRMSRINLTQVELSKATGIGRSTLCRKIKHPETMTYGEWLTIDRVLTRRGAT